MGTTEWITDVDCVECRKPYFVDGEDECTLDSCREINDEFECIECNSKNGIDWKTQEDECVASCTWPYTEIESNHCGIQCNDGFFVTDFGCESCGVPGCKHCSAAGECTYCFEVDHPLSLGHEDCSRLLTCPEQTDDLLINVPVHDYAKDNTMPSRCVSDCKVEYSVYSETSDTQIEDKDGVDTEVIVQAGPRCRYCNADCTECKEDNYSDEGIHHLRCTKCAGDLLAVLGDGVYDKCVETCDAAAGYALLEDGDDYCAYVGIE